MQKNTIPQEKEFTIIAKTISGLEGVLADEIRAAGGTGAVILHRAVKFSGNSRILYQCNYTCRTALRFLKPLWEFTAATDKDLYRQCLQLPWEQVMELGQTFAIDGVVSQSGITHSMYAALKTKDAIADHFRALYGKRPDVDTDNPDIRLNVHIHRNHCTIALDSSGTSLHLRGYKVASGQAPIGEVLASGLIMLSGWDGSKTFLDPMCGSGTILTEAAMIASRIPAGYYRKGFGFLKWKDFDASLWDEVKESCQPPAGLPAARIIGGDISPLALRDTRKNAGNAGVLKAIKLYPLSFAKLPRPEGLVHMVVNPPYGERVKADDIVSLYQMIGDTLKRNYHDSEAWIISGDLHALKFIGLKPSVKIVVYNGPIECRFAKFELYEGSRKGKYNNA
jgi:putative N6-adenine-specific DNA methylase